MHVPLVWIPVAQLLEAPEICRAQTIVTHKPDICLVPRKPAHRWRPSDTVQPLL